jgi:phosphoribosylformylglycinamidine cyclo-ligase
MNANQRLAKQTRQTHEIYDPAKPFGRQISDLVRLTHPANGPIKVMQLGKRFRVYKTDMDRFSELTGLDGIGTKGLLHWQMGTMEAGAQDAFAMVADDLIESGHVLVLMQDHIQIQEENGERILRIVNGLVNLARANPWDLEGGMKHPIVITAGETAIINTMQGFEVGITGTGYTLKGHEIAANIAIGDVLIGIGSSGAHSNGYSFLRKELLGRQNLKLDDQAPWNRNTTVGAELTIPTRTYLPAIKELIDYASKQSGFAKDLIHGMVHITGGGFSKLRELLPKGGDYNIYIEGADSLKPQSIFTYSFETGGIKSKDMYNCFNNGVGYFVAVDKAFASLAVNILGKHFPTAEVGTVTHGKLKVLVRSDYDNEIVEF